MKTAENNKELFSSNLLGTTGLSDDDGDMMDHRAREKRTDKRTYIPQWYKEEFKEVFHLGWSMVSTVPLPSSFSSFTLRFVAGVLFPYLYKM